MKPRLIRFGHGLDVHAFTAQRPLFLCGVKIPHEQGLQGHSDADVGLHALIDALLGAAALGDIGTHFPSNDPLYQNISSRLLLQQTRQILGQHNFQINNVDVTLVVEAPKIQPHVTKMRKLIATELGISTQQVSVKATTTEQLGFTGRKEGILALATAMIYSND
jgi:2-C-methyl-D-erythritol 2,4-cyclodiphosphate synthase